MIKHTLSLHPPIFPSLRPPLIQIMLKLFHIIVKFMRLNYLNNSCITTLILEFGLCVYINLKSAYNIYLKINHYRIFKNN